jgi:hypothetical protein
MRNVLIGILALGVVAVPAVAQETGPTVPGTVGAALYEMPVRTLAKGLKFDVTFKNEISSRSDRIGDIITGVLVNDVKDSTGTVIFPAKSTANVEIVDISGTGKESTNGRLVLVIRSVNVGNHTFRMHNAKDSVDAKKSTWTREPKKMDTPASSAGAVGAPVVAIGVVGRAPKGAGEGVNLVVAPGTAVTFELAEAVNVTS